jgi:hypothetical protein
MIRQLQQIISTLIEPGAADAASSACDAVGQLDDNGTEPADVARGLNAAFLISLAGEQHPEFARAAAYFDGLAESSEWGAVVWFYRDGLRRIYEQWESACRDDSDFAQRVRRLGDHFRGDARDANPKRTAELLWSVFFTEGAGILSE